MSTDPQKAQPQVSPEQGEPDEVTGVDADEADDQVPVSEDTEPV